MKRAFIWRFFPVQFYPDLKW